MDDWMIFGGIGLISEIGQYSQNAHINQLNSTRSAVANALRCDDTFEREMWNLVCDPSKHEQVWEKIETFKRNNPHLCIGRSKWDFVGKNRLIIENTGRKTLEIDEIIAANRSEVVSLLCRTHGKLSSIQASEVSMYNNFYLSWSALPNDKIYPVWNKSPSEVRSLKDTFSSIKVRSIEHISELVKNATGEQHDAIVYMVGLEFDPSREEAVLYITDCIKKMVNVPVDDYSHSLPNGVLRTTSSEQYNDYLSNGGVENSYIGQSIQSREQKERETKDRTPPFAVTYIPDGGALPQVMNDILWANAVLHSPDPTVKDSLRSAKNLMIDTYFDGSISGMIMLLLSIATILSIICALK